MSLNGSLGSSQRDSINFEESNFDVSANSVTEAIWIGGLHRVMWEMEFVSGTDTTYVVDLEGSMDASTWDAIAVEALTAPGGPGAGVTSKYPFVRFRCSTTQTTTLVNLRLNASAP